MPKPMRNKREGRPREDKEFDQHILDLARVTRVTQGGKHLSFRACVIIGDRHGRVGFGIAKGKDVQLGVEKAGRQAKKNLITVPIINETIPHAVIAKLKAAKILLKPAPAGSGIIAGGAVRVVLDLAGVPNVSSKILSKTKNKITIVKATFEALKSFKIKHAPIKPTVVVVEAEKTI
ncbi:MAG: 30S ribosomal protein S5 [Patescibacteria group bacterium]|nr:30S ribosomal protein S5 [Patescibacteria group bacterium]